MRTWRNWQTRMVQVHVLAKSIGVQVSSPAPKQYNPNQIFPVGDGFGLFVYFEKFEETHFKNGIIKRPNSKLRVPRKKKQS